MKPVDGWGGKGIMVFRQLKDILDQPKIVSFFLFFIHTLNLNRIVNFKMPSLNPNPNEDAKLYVVQEYLSNPYLLNGRKFDMRIYVFVKSVSMLNNLDTCWSCLFYMNFQRLHNRSHIILIYLSIYSWINLQYIYYLYTIHISRLR